MRFCTEAYTPPAASNLGNAYAHLTNYAVNKLNPAFQFNQCVDGLERALLGACCSYAAVPGREGSRRATLEDGICLFAWCMRSPPAGMCAVCQQRGRQQRQKRFTHSCADSTVPARCRDVEQSGTGSKWTISAFADWMRQQVVHATGVSSALVLAPWQAWDRGVQTQGCLQGYLRVTHPKHTQLPPSTDAGPRFRRAVAPDSAHHCKERHRLPAHAAVPGAVWVECVVHAAWHAVQRVSSAGFQAEDYETRGKPPPLAPSCPQYVCATKADDDGLTCFEASAWDPPPPLRRIARGVLDRRCAQQAVWSALSAALALCVLLVTYARSHNATCLQLLGYDVLIDEDLRPWLLEV